MASDSILNNQEEKNQMLDFLHSEHLYATREGDIEKWYRMGQESEMAIPESITEDWWEETTGFEYDRTEEGRELEERQHDYQSSLYERSLEL